MISVKKLINDPDAVTREALEGMEAAHGDRLRVSYEPAFVVRADAVPDLPEPARAFADPFGR